MREKPSAARTWLKLIAAAVCVAVALGIVAAQERAKRVPMTFALDCAAGDCPLLKGAPQTSGMRGGSVKLKPGESVGWHSTSDNEEALVILHGSGVANIEGGPDVPLKEKTLAYIPPATRHNVTNTGKEVLEYVWVVAPVGAGKP
jgi:mannose-6-phosphate isomerase-like protein (cupin superfamily)